MTIDFDRELDARGLLCPLPILKTKFQMDALESGQVLKVVATDAGSVRDMEAYARQTGNRLLGSFADRDEYVFFLLKA